jgi:hypothetical protein
MFEILAKATHLLTEARQSELDACESCSMVVACLGKGLALP